MTTHVLIACSKTKSKPAPKSLNWHSKTTTKSWREVWSKQKQSNLIPAFQLYTGRSFRQQLALCQQSKDIRPYILSAGGGLISELDAMIPSYEATLQRNRGPLSTKWHLLPFGGIGKLKLKSNDVVVSFAPPQYHLALLNDADIERIAPHLVVPSTSPLASIAATVIPIHPRANEVLNVAFTDLNTAFLKTYINDDIKGFERIRLDAEELPQKVERTAISNDDLIEKVKELKEIKTLGLLVRHLRDNLLIKASRERISAARNHVHNE